MPKLTPLIPQPDKEEEEQNYYDPYMYKVVRDITQEENQQE